MTPEEYNEHLTNLYGLVSGDLSADTIGVAAPELLDSIKERILKEGKNSNDGSIGQYSTKPLYASKNSFIRKGAFSPQGKNTGSNGIIGERLVPTQLFNQGKPLKYSGKFLKAVLKDSKRKYKRYTIVKADLTKRTSMYLPEGYKELRDIQSLRTDFVNLSYRGDLLQDYQMAKDAQAYLLGFTNEQQVKKREGLEAKYGHVFKATTGEKDNYINRVNSLLNRLTVNTLEGQYVSATVEDTKGFHY